MVKHIVIMSAVVLVAGLAVLSCGGDSQTETATPPASLLTVAKAPGLSRTSEIRVYAGDSLWEYINGGAELYHSYNFVEVATADYTFAGAELITDIYLFDSDDNAFGLYSQLRPDIPSNVPMGAAGFASENNLVFVKGPYVATITGFDSSPQSAAGVSTAGAMLNKAVPGKTDLPEMLSRLPSENAVPYSEKMYAESFLGQSALSCVYTRHYDLGGEILTLFLTTDEDGDKLTRWRVQLEGESVTVDLGLSPDDSEQLLSSVHGYYGQIVALGKAGYLAGAVGYNDSQREFVSTWLKSIGD